MKTIPFISLEHLNYSIKEQLKDAFESVMLSNNFILGENVSEFEKEYAKYCNTKYCVGVASGLDALTLSLKSLDIQAGDEVIVPANTFIASLISISSVGATPVLVDVNRDDFNIDVSKVEDLITDKTKGIMAVHLYGQSANLDKLKLISVKHGIHLIEDNAQAQGAKEGNVVTGSLGIVGCTSFYPGKNLGAYGDGGAVTTNDITVYNKLLALRNYGSTEKYFHDVVGFNSRLDELQAAFLRVKLKKMEGWNLERNKKASRYKENLKDIIDVELPITNEGNQHVFHLFVIKVKKRNELKYFLHENGVNTLIHYPIPCHLQKAYLDLNYKRGDFPITEILSEQILSLPLYIGMKDDDIDYVCNAIRNFYKGND
jgi:dTDP-4-amino-4,6-dideoxygalactose transaminase